MATITKKEIDLQKDPELGKHIKKEIYEEYTQGSMWEMESIEVAASAALSKRSKYVKRPEPSAF